MTGRTPMIFTPEQEELRATVRRFLAEQCPPGWVRGLMETGHGHDPVVWARLAGLGITGLTIPARYGGSGAGPVERLVVCEEMGRALFCGPYLSSSVLAVETLLASGDQSVQAEFLPRIAAGELIAAVALPGDGTPRQATGSSATRAFAAGGGYRIDGSETYVLDGALADLVLVAAQTDGGPSLFAVTTPAPGLNCRPLATIDMTRKLAALEFDAVPARLVGSIGAAEATVAHAMEQACVALAAEQAGGAQRCLEMSTEYAGIRYQFGRPIGSFQAVRHACAEMLLQVELARSAAYYAAWAAAEEPPAGSGPAGSGPAGPEPPLPLAASIAKAVCSEAFCYAAAANIQIHGGIGFTWEHDAHLYYRRAQSSALLFGSPVDHRETTATWLIDRQPPRP